MLVIDSDSTRADIAEAIGYLRDKQQRACIASTKAEIQVDIDGLLDRWDAAS